MRREEADARGILPVWYCWSMLGRASGQFESRSPISHWYCSQECGAVLLHYNTGWQGTALIGKERGRSCLDTLTLYQSRGGWELTLSASSTSHYGSLFLEYIIWNWNLCQEEAQLGENSPFPERENYIYALVWPEHIRGGPLAKDGTPLTKIIH